MEELGSDLKEIRKRHESKDLWIEGDTDGWQAHQDRGVLLDRIANLTMKHRYEAEQAEQIIDALAKLVATKSDELEAALRDASLNWSGKEVEVSDE